MDHRSTPSELVLTNSFNSEPLGRLALDLSSILVLSQKNTTNNAQERKAMYSELAIYGKRVLLNLQQPATMEKDVYLALQTLAEQLDLDLAKGQYCTDGFGKTHAEVTRLLEAAPWTLHPDHGCVLTCEVEGLDRAFQASQTPAH